MTKSSPVTILSASLALAMGPLAAQVQQLPHTALSAGAPTICPLPPVPGGLAPGDFESPDVPAQQFRYGFQLPNGSTTWQPWTFTNFSGIAANGSGFLSPNTNPPNPAAPSGTRVALLQGLSSMSAPFTFPAGIWRLRFKAAQRSWLGVNQQVVRVTIGGTEVFEGKPAGAVFEQCTTRALSFGASTPTTIMFEGLNGVGDHTAFVDDILVEPIRDWNSASTWNLGSLPGANRDVIIPAGVEVAMRSNCVADTVTVNGELLTTTEPATLSARWVAVSGTGAAFEVGRELTPFPQTFTLTLKGTAAVRAAMGAGTKFLMAMDGGRIDMHGIQKKSWSKLTSLNAAGNVIRVTDSSNWAPNDWVVVTYTGHVNHAAGIEPGPYSGPRSQRRQIGSINVDGDITLLGTPLLLADHCAAATADYAQGAQSWTLDQRAEVGMLTRNIKIVGEATPVGQTPFGGHVMIMACCDQMPAGQGRFANVELTEMGQAQVLGRYPLHWHMQRSSGAGQYARNCSIYKSHNRAVTIHGSHGVEVADNVCFDILGHAMFLEDGVETNNTFTGNLVVSVRKPVGCARMLPHDSSVDNSLNNPLDQPQNRSPAGFWISHPQNTIRDNVVADSLGVGYWFALHTQPTGLSTVSPWNSYFSGNATLASLGEFNRNVAHSVKMGIDVHDSIAINQGTGVCTVVPSIVETGAEDPRNDDILTNVMWQPSDAAILTACTIYGCTTGIYTGGGVDSIGTITFRNFVLADNGVHAHLASMDTVEQSVMIRDSGHLIFPTGIYSASNPSGNGLLNNHLHPFEAGYAYVVYDGPGRLRQCHLVGYHQLRTSVYFSNFGAARRHTDHRVSGLTFANGLPVVNFEDFATLQANDPTNLLAHPQVFGIAILDEDFSLTDGIAPNPNNPVPHTLITNHPMMHLTSTSGTTPDVPLNPLSPRAWLSPYKWAHLQVRYFSGTNPIFGTNLYGNYALLEMNDVPTAGFRRQAIGSWQPFPIGSNYLESTYLPSAQMRQLPVIVLPAGSTEADRVYELVVRNHTTALPPLQRADVSIDDFGTADVVRIQITHEALPNWNPTLFINDDPVQINTNGIHPVNLTPLLPPNQGGPAHPGAVTSYQRQILGGIATIDLRLVKPANANRAHRISITW